MLNAIKRFFKEEEGASGLEYTLLAALVTVVIAGFFILLQGYIGNIWTSVNTAFQTAGS